MREGDEVVVNVAALELGLGSGGFDVVHVNLTRGLEAGPSAGREAGDEDPHVIKLNYTSLQHPVAPGGGRRRRRGSVLQRPGAKGAHDAVGAGPAAARAPGAGGLGRSRRGRAGAA